MFVNRWKRGELSKFVKERVENEGTLGNLPLDALLKTEFLITFGVSKLNGHEVHT